jgi:hypothetical protein
MLPVHGVRGNLEHIGGRNEQEEYVHAVQVDRINGLWADVELKEARSYRLIVAANKAISTLTSPIHINARRVDLASKPVTCVTPSRLRSQLPQVIYAPTRFIFNSSQLPFCIGSVVGPPLYSSLFGHFPADQLNKRSSL